MWRLSHRSVSLSLPAVAGEAGGDAAVLELFPPPAEVFACMLYLIVYRCSAMPVWHALGGVHRALLYLCSAMPLWHAPGGVRRAFHCLSVVFRSATGKHCTEDAGTAERVAAKGQVQANLFQARPCHWVRAWHGGPRHQVRTQAFGRHVSHQT